MAYRDRRTDIDIVISPNRQQLEQLLARLSESEFETELEYPFDAFVRKSLFNIVDAATLWKVDLIFKQPTPFDVSRFSRRSIVDIAGVHLYTASPEDILITKLWWAKLGESERQINDVVGIIKVQGESLDLQYVNRWVAALEIQEQWAVARERAG